MSDTIHELQFDAPIRTVSEANGRWSSADLELVRRWYSSRTVSMGFDLDGLARRLGRLKSNVCRKARSLGLTNQKRRKLVEAKPPKARMFQNDIDRRRAVGERISKYIKDNGHPRGALGMKHTKHTREVLSEKSLAMWRNPDSKVNSKEMRQQKSDHVLDRIKSGIPLAGSHPYSRCKRGFREDIGGQWFKSSWEANYARYLNFLKTKGEIVDWAYEPQTFYFEAIKRGTRAYTPDFKVTMKAGHEWHEVKGWMDTKSKTRLRRMAKYYPQEKLVVIDKAWFTQAKRTGLDGVIKGWE